MRYRYVILIMIVGFITVLTYVFADELAEIPYFVSDRTTPNGMRDVEKDIGLSDHSVETLYITVQDRDPKYGYSFDEIQQLSQQDSIRLDPKLPIRLATDLAVSDAPLVSGTIELRGKSVRLADLKSFGVRIDASEHTTWRGQKVLNLNKHPYDYTKVRNKLSYDYFQLIPNMIRLDTRFVQLYVRDLTSSSTTGEEYVNYGLFTHVEEVDRHYLRRHGLDPDGYLYKAMNFEFLRYPEQLRNRHDPLYDPEKFETVLAIEGREYHDKLISMLDAVNDPRTDIHRVFERYFDEDNFLTWIAVNILMGNLDTSGNNFYLYSSRFSDKWYFIPWDYDKAWGYDWLWDRRAASIHPTRYGLTLYWGWPLAKRYFQEPGHVEKLSEKIEDIYQIITKEQTKRMLDEYVPIARTYALSMPDVQLLPDDIERFDDQYYSLVDIPEQNRERYYKLLEYPTPIFIGGPWVDDDQMTFTWNESFDFQGNAIEYELVIARDPLLTDVIFEASFHDQYAYTMEILPAGEYYWSIRIRDDEGHVQIPFESYINARGTFYHGVKLFTLE